MTDYARYLRSAAPSLAIATALLAGVTLVGHRAGFVPAAPGFNARATWLLLLVSLALWIRTTTRRRRWQLVGRASAAAVILWAAMAALEHVQSVPTVPLGPTGWPSVPAMSPQSAVLFMLLGLGVLLLDWETRRGVWPSQWLSVLTAGGTFVPLLGFMYGVPRLYSVPGLPPMPLPEVVTLFVLSLAVLLVHPDQGIVRIVTSQGASGILARATPAGAVALPMLLGWIALRGQRAGWYDEAAGTAFFVFATITIFTVLTWRIARTLDRADQHRAAAEAKLRFSEEKFSGLFRSSPDAIAVARLADGRILEVNEGFRRVTGFPPDEVLGRTAAELNLWRDLPMAPTGADTRAAVLSNVEARFLTKAGDTRTGLCSTELVTVGGEACVLTVVRDISEREHAQAAIKQANERLAGWVGELEARSREIGLLTEMGDLLQTCVTPQEASAVIARFARELLPDSQGALCLVVEAENLLETTATWGDGPTTEAIFVPEACWALRRGRPYTVHDPGVGPLCDHVRPPYDAPLHCVPMVAQGTALGVLHVRGAAPVSGSAEGAASRPTDSVSRLVMAVAEHAALALANVRLRQRLRDESIRDQLTNLFNRRHAQECLGKELLRARRMARPLALIMLDLDRFKAVNDRYGHEAGDRLLKATAQLLSAQLRASDLAARYGGEEFLVVMPETSLEAAATRADELRRAVKALVVSYHGHLLSSPSVSMGVAVFPTHGETPADLLGAADAALYSAKDWGGDRAEVARTGAAGSGPARQQEPADEAS
jgi:diguanylate cyclase (GGDEF)-like protein/PAS domain S-box-containing protein